MTDQERRLADAICTLKTYCEETACKDCFVREICKDYWGFEDYPGNWPLITDPDDRPDEPTICGIPLSTLGFHDDD